MSIKMDAAMVAELNSRRRAFCLCLKDPEVEEFARSLTDTYFTKPILAVCPCCGYPTLYERRSYDICRICGWEDDGQDDPPFGLFSPDEIAGGPNSDYSLTEARSNFIRYRQQYRPSDEGPFEKYAASWPIRERIILACDAMLPVADPVTYLDALPRINALFKRLFEVEYGKPYPGSRR